MSNWDIRFLHRALALSEYSKDPNRQVGCVLVRDKFEVSTGYNGFARGVKDDYRLENRDVKLSMIVHVEANAIANAARFGCFTRFTTAYITLPPCAQCASLLIQAGVVRVVYAEDPEHATSRWKANRELALELLIEAGVKVLEAEYREYYSGRKGYVLGEEAVNGQ